jgi:hypothetical protein
MLIVWALMIGGSSLNEIMGSWVSFIESTFCFYSDHPQIFTLWIESSKLKLWRTRVLWSPKVRANVPPTLASGEAEVSNVWIVGRRPTCFQTFKHSKIQTQTFRYKGLESDHLILYILYTRTFKYEHVKGRAHEHSNMRHTGQWLSHIHSLYTVCLDITLGVLKTEA